METTTADKILNVAQEMVRTRGYSAFSYADIAARVGIRKASIHYHFPSKEDLVIALVQRYRDHMMQVCDRIANSTDSPEQKLVQFADLYRDGLKRNQICLCAMLAANYEVIPTTIQDEVQVFFNVVEIWLTQLLQQGGNARSWLCAPSAEQESKGMIAMLQGAQLLARSTENGIAVFDQIVYPLLNVKALRS